MNALDVTDLVVTFGRGSRAVRAVDDVSLRVPKGGAVGLVGESGSGKSTVARAIVCLQRATSGSVMVDGVELTSPHGLSPRERARLVQMIFQDPSSSLDPRMTVGEAIEEALLTLSDLDVHARRLRVRELLDLARLRSAVTDAYPRQLSGGMCQRVAIARCLAVEPRLIVADEITSALDASVQGVILNLIVELRAALGLSMLFISHNLAVVRYISDETVVMSHGRVVEQGPSDAIVHHPHHEYTKTLVAAIPRLENAGTSVLSSWEP